MTPKPQARTNLVHQQILSGLIETKPVSWSFKEIVTRPAELGAQSADGAAVKRPDTDEIVKTKVTGTGLANPLAGNVSVLNVDRAAKRWMR